MARVMVVDDDEYVGLLYSEELEDEGYEVVLVRTPERMLERVGRDSPDLIVLDLCLAECDGRDLLSRLKQAYPQLPVVVSSGFDLSAAEVRELPATFVAKSFDLGPLKETIARLLRRQLH